MSSVFEGIGTEENNIPLKRKNAVKQIAGNFS